MKSTTYTISSKMIFKLEKRFPLQRAIFSILFLILGSMQIQAATITSTSTGGTWATASTWVGGVVPATGDTVIIATTAGNVVEIGANLTQTALGSVLINNGAILSMNTSGVSVVLGALTINNGGSVIANRPLSVLGTTTVSGTINFGSTSASVRAMIFTGDVTLNSTAVWDETSGGTNTVLDTFSFGSNLVVNSSTITTLTGSSHTFTGSSKTISGTVALTLPLATFTGNYTSTLDFTSNTLTVTGAAIRLTNSNTINVLTSLAGTGGIVQDVTGILNLSGNVSITTLTATAIGNLVNYKGAGQTAKVTVYDNLTISGSGTKTFSTTPTINNILSMEGTAILTVTTGTITYGANATLQYNTATARNSSSEEWISPFTAIGGVLIKNTGIITLNASKTFTASPLKVFDGATLNLGTLNLISPSVLNLENGTTGSLISGTTGTLTLGGNVNVVYTGSGNNDAVISSRVALTNATTRVFTIADEGTTAADLTISGIISTTGSLTKSGLGTLVLSGVNTYTGVTTINEGVISVATIGNGAVAGNLGQAASTASNLVLSGGVLRYTGATASTNRGFVLTTATTSTIDVTTNNLTISGSSTNTTGALTKIGNGVLLLSGTNLHTGLTTITEGTLRFAASNTLSSCPVTINGGVLDIVTFNDTIGAVTLIDGSITGTTGVLTGTSYDVQNGTISAILAGGVSLTKSTTGIVTLTSTNTYTGTTTISGGVLYVNGSIASGSAVSVASGATLAGNGTVAGTVSLTGILSPGSASTTVGTVTAGAFTINPSAQYTIDITNVVGTEGTNWDLLTSTGAITVSSTSGAPAIINLIGSPTGFDGCTNYTWKIVGGTSVASFAANKFSVNTTSFGSTFLGTFSVTNTGNNINLVYTAPVNTVGAASSAPTLCINTVMTTITHATTIGNGVGIATGLPAGLTATWASNSISISGTPTASGTFNYTVPFTGGCGLVSATGTIIVTPDNTVSAASSSPTICINTPLTSITHTTVRATGIGTASGLPAGVSASWSTNTITINGTPTESGTFNYNIPLVGGCGTINATGTIIVTPDNTVSIASSSPTLCINTALTAITHTTIGATGIGTALGLPAGVTASWVSNTITISGTPSSAGTFNYSVPLTGGCGSINATGTIIVTPSNTVSEASSNPTLCINTALTAITHTTTGATGIGTATGLPTGVSALWSSNTITISGTPSTSGTFNYSIPLSGGCGTVNATGTLIVTPSNTASAATSSPTLCINTALTAITHTTTGATGIGTATGLPTGVSASWSSNTITISGTPSSAGTFNYSIPLTGGCSTVNANGTIIVTPDNTVSAASSAPTLCINTALTAITHTTTGATGIGTAAGLPAGVSASWSSNTISISGTPTVSGTFNYTIPLTGGCSTVNATGTIVVDATAVGGTISGASYTCVGNTSGLLTLTGNIGAVVRWEYAVSPYTTWNNIANTATTYTSGALTESTAFRAVVQNGSCSEVNSSPITVTIATTTWVSGAWSNGAPTSTVSALITSSLITGGTSIEACSLVVSNGASVSVSSGDSVTLAGPLQVGSGSLVTFNNNANLIQSGTTNLNTGSILVKRNSSALKRQDYTLWSSPVANQKLQSFSPLTLSNRFYTYNTSTNLYDLVASPSTTNFETAKGYLIRMPNNHPTTATVWNGTFTGVPNNGDYTYNLDNNGAGMRFNLVGNPYPSPIDAASFILNPVNENTITGALYFWRKTNNALSPSYCTWTLGGFVSNGEAQVYDPNDVIQTGQAFFVEATGVGSTVKFDNTMRSNNHTNQFFKNATTIEKNRVWLNLTSSTGLFSQTMVGYITNATQGVDTFIDGKYINDGEIAISSLIDGTSYAIQGRALPFDVNDIVPLSIKVANAGDYTIAISHVDGLFLENQNVYVRDNYTGVIHDLSQGVFTFSSVAGTFNDRFEVMYQMPLGYSNPTFAANQVVIFKNTKGDFEVNSGSSEMSILRVYDISGRQLLEKNNINDTRTTFSTGLTNEIYLVQIISESGIKVNKKVVN